MVFGQSRIQFGAILSSIFFNMLPGHVSRFSVCDLSPGVLHRYCCLDPSLSTCLKLIFHRVSRCGFGVINSWWIHIWPLLHLNIVDLKHVHLVHILLRANPVAGKLTTVACLLPFPNEMEEDKRKSKTNKQTQQKTQGNKVKQASKQKTYLIREW